MMPMIHRPAPWSNDYVVPCPRSTDAIGAALRGAYAGGQQAPDAMIAALRALDRVGCA